jgi:hypothetical protein
MIFTRRLGFEPLESRRLLTAVDIPDDLTGQVLGQVSAPLNVDNATGIRAAEIRLAYDTTVLDISESNIVAGSVWAGDATVDIVASVDDAAGTIIVSIFGANALPATSGSLVEFQFTIQSGVTVGATTTLDLTEVRINEGAITLDTTPQPGPDATDGLLTVTEDVVPPTGDAMVSGTVYADVNNNNQPDSTEGLPGVTVTLVNTTTNAQVQTTTLSDGRYQFANLAPGSYRIQELQPAAYLDGGVNELSIELVAGQDLTGQDFRELGLRPEFIYNRLFTTLVMPIGSANWVSAITQINADAENGVVNAQIVPAATSALQAEGESITALDSQATLVPVLIPTGLTAEGEGSTELIVSRAPSSDTSESRATTVCTVSPPPSTVNLETAVVRTSTAQSVGASTAVPAADSVDFVWSEDESSPDAVVKAETAEDDQACNVSDDLLAIDEAFAVTDSW